MCDIYHKFFAREELAGHGIVKYSSRTSRSILTVIVGECKIEGKSFKNTKELDKHIRKYHSEVLIKCEYCGSELKESSLRVHLELACASNPARRPRERVRLTSLQPSPASALPSEIDSSSAEARPARLRLDRLA